MAESPVATTHLHAEAPNPSRTAAAPDVAPEVAPESTQALVRALHPTAAAGATGAPTPPPPPTWAARRSTTVRDLVALQRMAGNRAVTDLVARRSTPVLQRQPSSPSTDPAQPQVLPPPTSGNNITDPQQPAPEDKPRAMVVRASSMAQAAKDLAGFTKTLTDKKTGLPLDVVIIALESKVMEVYDGAGNHLKGPFELALPKGTSFDEGVFVTMPGGGQSMRMRLDPKLHRFRPYEDAAILEERPDPPKGAAPGAVKPAGATTTAAKPPPPAGSADSKVEPAPNAPKGFDLRKYVKNPAGLDELRGRYAQAAEFIVVRTPLDDTGTGKPNKGSGPRSSGFAGEVEGHGTPPNRPPWPVTMDGPKALPIGGKGTFLANINWQAQGGGTLGAVTAQMGNDIHYRWEVFDITAAAKREAEKQAERAKQAKAMIQATMAKGVMPDVVPPKGVAEKDQPGVTAPGGAGGAGTGGSADPKGQAATPKTVTLEDDTSFKDDLAAKTGSKAGSGTDVTGAAGGDDEFNREFRNLWGDTKRSWAAVGGSKAETYTERRSDDVANLSAVGLLPVSAVVTLLGASLRWGSDQFAGERLQQEIPMKTPGTYLVRVITTPRSQMDKDGNPLVYPASVASQTVEVVEMDKMVRDALADPGAREGDLSTQLDNAEKAAKEGHGNQATVDSLKSKLENLRLDVYGDPRVMLERRIADKEKELKALTAVWEPRGIRGPIIEVDDQLDVLRKRLKLYELQERRRVEGGGGTLAPAIRINASLASEVTGQAYPLVLSLGPMAMASPRHKWKVLDATSKKAEGFEGVGDTVAEAIQNALAAFGHDAQYGRGIIGVELPPQIKQQLQPTDKTSLRIESQPTGWSVARTRIDDLVMTLVALGLIVASAGTAAAVIGGVVAVAKLIHRLYSGTLELDVETVSDFLAVFGAAGAIAQSGAKAAQVAAGVRVRKLGDVFVLLPESADIESRLSQAATAFARAGDIARKVEWANEALGYAGLAFGNATFLLSMADISIAESEGKMTHAEARRARATAIGGAIQNNGLFLAGNRMKAKAAKQAADKAAAARATSNESPGATGAGKGADTGTSGEPVAPKESVPPKESVAPKESVVPQEPATGKPAPEEAPTKGAKPKEGGAPEKPVEPVDTEPKTVREPRPGEKAPGAAGGTAERAGTPAGAPAEPIPGSPKARAAAKKTLEGVVTSSEPHAGIEDAIKQANGWKEALKSAVSKLSGPDRAAAEKALVEVRQRIVDETWASVKEAANGAYDNLRMENAGTTSFGSDIDATIRPLQGSEAQATGPQMAEQIRLAGEAAQAMSKALRARLGGGETDIVIDTNIYSFIGEGRIKPTDAAGKASQQQVDIVVGLAEQRRGQNEAQFKAFEQRLIARLGDPRVVAEAKALLAKAREFHQARVNELSAAMERAKADPANKTEAAQKRAAREELLTTKKNELSELSSRRPPEIEKITAKQAEINWFAPDAYATPSAFKQAVAHGQRLKGAGRLASEYTGPEVAAKLREAAGRLAPDDPHAARLREDAKLVEDQQRLLDSTLSEQKALQNEAPMNAERVDDLGRRADRIREAIAARAEKVVVAEIFGETAPSDRPSGARLSESAAASGANMGMLEDHVRHAADIDSKVKAAAKYAARIAMAEMLSGLRPAGDAIAQLLGEFVKSRWDLAGDFAPEMLRDMFLKYALKTGRGNEIIHDQQGLAVGVTDQAKQAFIDDVMGWARSTNEGVQAAAIGSKAFDSPVTPAPAPGGVQAAPGGGPSGGGPGPGAGGGGGTSGGGGTGGRGPLGGGTAPKPDTAAGQAPQERPTVVPAAPESSGPATRRDATGQGATEQTAPAKPAPDEPGSKLETIPGGIKVTADDYAVTARANDDPTALVRLEPAGNTIRLTDIYRRDLPAGSGVILLTAALKKIKATRGNEILVHNIINPETVEAHKANQDPAQSKLGKTVQRALEAAGLQAGTMRWEIVHEKLCIVVEIR